MRCPFALALVVAVGFASGANAQHAPREPQVPDLKVEKYTLPNGLDVVLLEDHTTPVVGVNIWYKVGSKDEKTGRTGFAHLFEHMMFQGSQHHDGEYISPIEKLGAQFNGSTTEDRTNYFETLPSNGLELALWLEADRMGFLLPALTQGKLDNQREVVKNERRQSVDNVPYGLAEEALLEALYPPGHPYYHSVIGSMADLSSASRQDVVNFFRTYYAPNNASLVLVGDFQPAEAKRLIARYFGPIPRGPNPDRPKPNVPKLDAPKHITMTDRVALARAQLIWPTVPANHEDEPALDLLAAVLGGLDKENRLYLALMYNRQLAAGAHAAHPTQLLAGMFEISLTARPGQALDELVKLADAEVERMKAEGPTEAELAKAQTQRETGLIMGLQAAGRKADFLNRYNCFDGDPLAYKDEMRKLFRVTPADVKRVANQYLTANRVRLDVTPGAQAKRPPEVEVDRKAQTDVVADSAPVKDDFDRSKMPTVGPNPKFTPPPIVRRKLSSGLEVLIAERHTLPILSLQLVFKGGQNLEPEGKEGLAGLTAGLLTEGTATLDSLGLAGALSEIGADIGANSDRESSSLGLTTLTKHADRGLELFADVLTHPAFPEKELERLRKQKLAALARRADNAQAVAGVVFPKTLYGGTHPYGRIDSIKSVEGIQRSDVEALYKSIYIPNNAALIVVGDITPDAAVAKLETALKDWKPGTAPTIATATAPATPKPALIFLVDKPGAAQSVLYAGHVGAARSTPDYFAINLMNAILGGQFSSRINLNLREEKGYTYGAQTMFLYRQGPGPFLAATSVQTAVTKEALAELVREIHDIRGSRPPTDSELTFAKDRLIRGFPSRFETTRGLAGQLEDLVVFKLPDDYFTTYQSKIEAITKADVERAAQRYLDPDHLLIVVVGDRAKIEPGLKQLPFAKEVHLLDADGNPASATAEAAAR